MIKIQHVRLPETNDRSYDIVFGLKIPAIADELSAFGRRPVFIITDDNVAPLYGNALLHELGKMGCPCEQIVIPAGEQSKSRRMKETVEDHLIELGATRHSLIVALGGGVVGDLAGFVAATLFRGVPYVQIPTSLLAQVDSSVGGKVAVDHPRGKNLIGAFHQPLKVFIDVAMLSTLPEIEFRSGLAEVIKYAAIMDANLFTLLKQRRKDVLSRKTSLLQQIVARCCAHKAKIVEKDEREDGLRRILNFGHTVGHAVESLSEYRLRHGEAVAIGMAAEAVMSNAFMYCSEKEVRQVIALLRSYDLPACLPKSQSIEEIVQATFHDKKAKDGFIQYTLLRKIGQAKIGVDVSPVQLQIVLKKMDKFVSAENS